MDRHGLPATAITAAAGAEAVGALDCRDTVPPEELRARLADEPGEEVGGRLGGGQWQR